MIVQFVSVIIHEYEFLIHKIRDECKEKLNSCSLILLPPHLNRSRAWSRVLAVLASCRSDSDTLFVCL